MAEVPTITWTGASGTQYTYWIYQFGSTFKDAPGNYMFIRETQPTRWKPVYIGESGNLADRLDNVNSHHKIACARREGATHICAHVNTRGDANRLLEEADLIQAYGPVCND